jgi:uncharacterized protein YcgI (DUF1989 family)
MTAGVGLPEGIETTGNRTAFEPISADGRPEPGRRYLVPARQARAVRLRRGERLELENVHGTQVGDAWAFNAEDPAEFMSMEHLRADLRRLGPREGDALVTNRRRAILHIETDTSPGVHDTLIAACDPERYRLLGVQGYHDNCTHNLHMALSAIGCAASETPAPLNLWMNIPVAPDGALSWCPPRARAGDRLILRAELDCVVVVSACPQDLVPVNGEDCVPRELALRLLS